MIHIVDTHGQPTVILDQIAQMLVDSFREHWPTAWATLEEAQQEVRDLLVEDNICLVALNEAGEAVGMVGGLPEYEGNVWELHPLVVRIDQQGRNIGRQLVMALEAEVIQRGGLTIQLGSDDEDNMTSLSQGDIYDDLYGKMRDIRNLKRHPYEFYQKLGFQIVGVVPDANGRNKPDIIMAKRVIPKTS
ncbi:MAG: GNAT family N-acetyltransferase [Anaerolineae bacterium]